MTESFYDAATENEVDPTLGPEVELPSIEEIGGSMANALLSLTLSPEEKQLLRVVAPLVGSTPRHAKRFINTYRVIKARAFVDTEPVASYEALLALTALVMGLPSRAPDAFTSALASDERTLREWLRYPQTLGLTDPAEQARLRRFLAEPSALGDLPVSDLFACISIAKRFAWPVDNTVS